jgi:hypothetical protein
MVVAGDGSADRPPATLTQVYHRSRWAWSFSSFTGRSGPLPAETLIEGRSTAVRLWLAQTGRIRVFAPKFRGLPHGLLDSLLSGPLLTV